MGEVGRHELHIVRGSAKRRLALLTQLAAAADARLAAGCDGIRIARRYGLGSVLAIPEIGTTAEEWLQLVEAVEVGHPCILSTDLSEEELLCRLGAAAECGRTSLPRVSFVDASPA